MKTIEKCGEFNPLSQGARKRSSANQELAENGGGKYTDWVEAIEYETYYPKLMLEQRMNNKMNFRNANELWANDEWSFDLESQLSTMTSILSSEKDRLLEQSQYYH